MGRDQGHCPQEHDTVSLTTFSSLCRNSQLLRGQGWAMVPCTPHFREMEPGLPGGRGGASGPQARAVELSCQQARCPRGKKGTRLGCPRRKHSSVCLQDRKPLWARGGGWGPGIRDAVSTSGFNSLLMRQAGSD